MSLCTDSVIHALGNYRRYKDEGDGERSQNSGRGTPLRTLAEETTLQLFRNCFYPPTSPCRNPGFAPVARFVAGPSWQHVPDRLDLCEYRVQNPRFITSVGTGVGG